MTAVGRVSIIKESKDDGLKMLFQRTNSVTGTFFVSIITENKRMEGMLTPKLS